MITFQCRLKLEARGLLSGGRDAAVVMVSSRGARKAPSSQRPCGDAGDLQAARLMSRSLYFYPAVALRFLEGVNVRGMFVKAS